jgi:hypothetical protein
MSDKSTITDHIYNPPNFNISDEIKERIVRNYIEPSYQHDIHKLIEGKKNWKLVGQIFETISKAFVAIGGIVSFAAGSYNNYNLSFVAGAISTISLATLSFSSFGYKEQKKHGLELNNILKKLKLDEVPINERCTEDIVSSRQQTIYSSQNNYQTIINSLDEENRFLRNEIDELKMKEKSDYNNHLEISKKEDEKQKINSVQANKVTSIDNTINNKIEEIKNEEKIEIRIHP